MKLRALVKTKHETVSHSVPHLPPVHTPGLYLVFIYFQTKFPYVCTSRIEPHGAVEYTTQFAETRV